MYFWTRQNIHCQIIPIIFKKQEKEAQKLNFIKDINEKAEYGR